MSNFNLHELLDAIEYRADVANDEAVVKRLVAALRWLWKEYYDWLDGDPAMRDVDRLDSDAAEIAAILEGALPDGNTEGCSND